MESNVKRVVGFFVLFCKNLMLANLEIKIKLIFDRKSAKLSLTMNL